VRQGTFSLERIVLGEKRVLTKGGEVAKGGGGGIWHRGRGETSER